ncbi:MAG TPA: nucleoside diphosphate kinase regulator [Ignavibacteriaceae bacterium]|nr:nucleoside diphosphate kinase regulator [Ignavibacteriaceae bacterium]
MKKRKIVITKSDRTKLRNLFYSTIGFRSRDLKTVKELFVELDRAEIIDDEAIDKSIVTMNSTVEIQDVKTKKEYTYTIVYPEDANLEENRISILAPIGTALLGYSEGDIIIWEVPAGKRKILIKKILYQPEAAVKAS